MDNEVTKLKNEIAAKNAAIEAEKYTFARQLMGGMGEQMMKEIGQKSIKLSWFDRVRLKIAIWKNLRNEKKRAKQLLKQQ